MLHFFLLVIKGVNHNFQSILLFFHVISWNALKIIVIYRYKVILLNYARIFKIIGLFMIQI
jgi:hypothetical protein